MMVFYSLRQGTLEFMIDIILGISYRTMARKMNVTLPSLLVTLIFHPI